MFKNLIHWFASEIPISINPSAGSPGSKVTVIGTNATVNGTVSIYWESKFMGNATANNMGEFSYTLTIPENATVGMDEITALDNATGITGSKLFRVITITVNPAEGPSGTKITVAGAGFLPEN